jgi:hypothetical protein
MNEGLRLDRRDVDERCDIECSFTECTESFDEFSDARERLVRERLGIGESGQNRVLIAIERWRAPA